VEAVSPCETGSYGEADREHAALVEHHKRVEAIFEALTRGAIDQREAVRRYEAERKAWENRTT
jgi:hypothetical protein